MANPSYTLTTGQTISSGSTPTNLIPKGYSFDASGKLTNAQGQEFSNPTAQPSIPMTPLANPAPGSTMPTPTPISNPVQAPTNPAMNTGPTLPTPTAPSTLQSFFGSATDQVNQAQTQADQALKARTDATQAQIESLNKQQSDLQTLQANGMASDLADVQAATKQKQDALTLEQQQWQKNYDLNQGFISQMQDLVTQGNAQIEQTKNLPISSTILNNKIHQSVSDLAAQIGSIQALMSAASGQMGAAKTQLDTTVATVSSILQDKVDYYKTLQDFYQKQSDANDTKLATLTKDQKDYLDLQVKQSQDQLAQVQKNAQALSDAMTNPTTALAYNQAGVTVNDTPEQINQKLATYGYSKELSDLSQKMAAQGYNAVIPGQKPPTGAVVTEVTDSKGVTHQYYAYKAPTNSTPSGTNGTLTKAQYDKFSAVGVPSGLADAITAEILSGTSLDQIRNDLKANNQDASILDKYDNIVGIASLLKTAKPSSTGFN